MRARRRERAAPAVRSAVAVSVLDFEPSHLCFEHRLPAASTTRAFVDAGGLMSYGADGPSLFRHGAKFVHRILQGRQPNDLPIEQPTKFELAINLKTAKAMNLTIPEVLLRADSLLE
jgi:ABC-type uncharacterized transport system substrate-binding protein